MTSNVLSELRRIGRGLPAKAPPIPVGLGNLGLVGHLENRRGLYLNSALRHHVVGLLKDQARAERAAREISAGRWGADALLPIAARISDRRDAVAVIRSMRAALTSWDDYVAAKEAGKSLELCYFKSPTSPATNLRWVHLGAFSGYPPAFSYGGIPGAAALDSDTTGAFKLPMRLGASDKLYLTNFSYHVGFAATLATSMVLMVDLLQAAGGIGGNVATSQAVSTPPLPRWTGGAGLQIALEVTAQLGGTAATVTISYVDQDGNNSITPAAAMTTNGIVQTLEPSFDNTGGNLFAFLAAGDYGVRAIQDVKLSAGMGVGGTMAALLYKPLLMVFTPAILSFLERSTPVQLGGARMLTEVAQGSKPCLSFFYKCAQANDNRHHYIPEFVWG